MSIHLILLVFFSLNLLPALPIYAPPENDKCPDAPFVLVPDTIFGTTVGSSPDTFLSKFMNPTTNDVFYKVTPKRDTITSFVLRTCVCLDESTVVCDTNQELGIALQSSCDIDENCFRTGSCYGLNNNRSGSAPSLALSINACYTDTIDTAIVIVKALHGVPDTSFTLITCYHTCLELPLADAGPRTEFFCATGGRRSMQLRGNGTAKNGGELTYEWRVVREHQGTVQSINPIDAASTTITFIGRGPYEADVILTVTEFVKTPCDTFSISAIDTVRVIGQAPEVNFPDTFIVCKDQPTILMDNGKPSGCLGGVEQWDWRPANGLDDPSKRNPVCTRSNSNTYTVTLTCSACTDAQNVFVKVSDGPTAKASADDPKCVGQDVHFTDESTPPPGGAISKYEWYYPDGAVDTLSDPTHQFDTPGEHEIQLIVTDENGCKDTFKLKVEITEGPLIDFGTIDFSSCDPEVRFFISADSGIPPYDYDIDFENDGRFTLQGQLTRDNQRDTFKNTYNVTSTKYYTAVARVEDGAECITTKTIDLQFTESIEYLFEEINRDCCLRSTKLMVNNLKGTAPFTFNWDENCDDSYELTNSRDPYYEAYWSTDIDDYCIRVKVVDSEGCFATKQLIGSVCDSIEMQKCCHDFGGSTPANYLACVYSNNPIFCQGDFGFWHYKIANEPFADVVPIDLQNKILDGYQAAEASPIYFPINNNNDDYPEAHLIRGYNRAGDEITEFSGQIKVLIEYPERRGEVTYANKDVPWEILRLFYLDEAINQWVLVENSQVSAPEMNCNVNGEIGFLGKVFTVMGYIPPQGCLIHGCNFPNPFNPRKTQISHSTNIAYVLTADAEVDIQIFNITGGLVWSQHFDAGIGGGKGAPYGQWHEIPWNGVNTGGRIVASGSYICQVTATCNSTNSKGVEQWIMGIVR